MGKLFERNWEEFNVLHHSFICILQEKKQKPKQRVCTPFFIFQYNRQVALRLAQVDELEADSDTTPWREEISLRRLNGPTPEPPSYASTVTPSPVRYRTTSLKYKQRTWSNGRSRRVNRGRKKKIRLFLSRMTDVDTIDRCARFLFPTSFVIFNIVYWSSYLTKLYNEWYIYIKRRFCAEMIPPWTLWISTHAQSWLPRMSLTDACGLYVW